MTDIPTRIEDEDLDLYPNGVPAHIMEAAERDRVLNEWHRPHTLRTERLEIDGTTWYIGNIPAPTPKPRPHWLKRTLAEIRRRYG